MKKIITTLALGLAVVSSGYSQGLVFFSNQNNTKISTNSVVNGAAAGVTAAASGMYYYALFYSTTQTTVGTGNGLAVGTNSTGYAFNSTGWVNSGLMATNSGATTGRFAGNTADSGNNSTIATLAGVTAAQFVVLGWSANLGTLAQAEAFLTGSNPLSQSSGWFGESMVSGAITTGNGGTQVTPATMGISAPQIPGFILGEVIPVPEPGTLALAALGGASLLMFRRKK